jgi:alanyl-tRNA synthetase
LVFAQHPAAGRDMAAVLKRVLASHPGKGGGSRDFVRAKLTEASGAGAAIDVARKLVAG